MAWKALLLALCALGVVAASSELRAQQQTELLSAKANPRQAFQQWLVKHNKLNAYANDLLEMEKRFSIWKDNLDFCVEYNAKHTSHWLGLNSLADLSHDEYKARYALGYAKYQRPAAANRPTSFTHGSLDEAALPTAVDWREKKAVAEVKNQLTCGSCWAFATTGSVEGINAIVTGEVVSLSEQELVDCDTEKDKGCGGGLMDYAYEFIINNGGIDTEEDYPYTAQDGVCQADKLNRKVVTIDGYEDVPGYDEVALKKAVSQQPVAVAIEADQRAFQLYVGGVFDDESCGEQLDHGVLAVGYGVEGAAPGGDDDDGDQQGGVDRRRARNYWIVKNSWGAAWGDHGYIRLRMGRGKAGMCGIAIQASYPLKKGPNPPTPPPTPGPKPGPAPGPKPGPKPEPVECDATTACPPDNTCCCVQKIGSYCLSWGCCPMPDAVCCADKQHCCPSDLPVCETDTGSCKAKPSATGADALRSVPWATKVPAQRKELPWGWPSTRGGAQQRQRIKPVVS